MNIIILTNKVYGVEAWLYKNSNDMNGVRINIKIPDINGMEWCACIMSIETYTIYMNVEQLYKGIFLICNIYNK